MSTLGEDTAMDIYRQFTPEQRIFIIAAVMIMLVGATLNGSLILILLTRYRRVGRDLNALLTFNLNIADFLYCFPLMVINSLKLIHNDYSVLGPHGCNIEGFFVCIGSMWSVGAIMWLGLERYYVIVKERQKSKRFWATMVSFGWLQGFFLAIVPFLVPGSGYKLQAAGMYCAHDWSSKVPIHVLVIFSVLFGLFGNAFIIAYLYWRIYQKVRAVQRGQLNGKLPAGTALPSIRTFKFSTVMQQPEIQRSAIGGGSSSGNDSSSDQSSKVTPAPPKLQLIDRKGKSLGVLFKGSQSLGSGGGTAHTSSREKRRREKKDSLERLVFTKSLILTVGFFTSWIFYTVVIALTFAGITIPPWYDVFSCIFALLFSTYNFFCIVMLDLKVRAVVLEALQPIRSLFRWQPPAALDKAANTVPLSNYPYPFSPTARAYVFLAFFIISAGAIPNLLLVLLLAAKRHRWRKDLDMYLTFNLNVADVLFCTPLAVIQVFKLIANDYSLLGLRGCDIEGFFVCAGSIWSVCALQLIGLERYMVIVHERRRSRAFWTGMVVLGWFQGLVLGGLPFVLPNTPYVLQAAHMYCAHSWGSRDPLGMLVVFVCLFDIFGNAFIIGFCYLSIHRKVQQVHRGETLYTVSLNTITGRSNNNNNHCPRGGLSNGLSLATPATNDIKTSNMDNPVGSPIAKADSEPALALSDSELSPHRAGSRSAFAKPSGGLAADPDKSKHRPVLLERFVFVKSVVLTVTFFASWTLYSVLIVITFAGYAIPPWYDALSGSFALFCSAINFCCIVLLDVRVRVLVTEAFRPLLRCACCSRIRQHASA
ncbi:hypothetical protein RI367_004932 [Sorochytrium milnesiophthora]